MAIETTATGDQSTTSTDQTPSLAQDIFSSEGDGTTETQQTTEQSTQQSTEQAATATQQTAETQQTSQQTTAPVQLTPELITQLAANAATQAVTQQQTAQQQAAQIQQQQRAAQSPEEIDRQFNVVLPNAAQIENLFKGGPEAVATMQSLLHDTSKMAVTIAAHYVNNIANQLRQEFAPATSFTAEQQQAAAVNEFYTAHPDLKTVEPLLVSIKDRLEAQGFKGTKEEVFNKISSEARAILKGANIQLPAAGAASTQTQTAAPVVQTSASRQMSTLTGGRAGAAGSAATAAGGSTAKTIFG